MKNLKSTRPGPAVSPADMLRIAGVAAPEQPSAVVYINGADGKSAMLSVRMTEATLEALASYNPGSWHDAAARDC